MTDESEIELLLELESALRESNWWRDRDNGWTGEEGHAWLRREKRLCDDRVEDTLRRLERHRKARNKDQKATADWLAKRLEEGVVSVLQEHRKATPKEEK